MSTTGLINSLKYCRHYAALGILAFVTFIAILWSFGLQVLGLPMIGFNHIILRLGGETVVSLSEFIERRSRKKEMDTALGPIPQESASRHAESVSDNHVDRIHSDSNFDAPVVNIQDFLQDPRPPRLRARLTQSTLLPTYHPGVSTSTSP